MTPIMVSKRGTITLPPELRKKLGLDKMNHPMVLVDEREDGLLLRGATPVAVRSFPKDTMDTWIKDDEAEMTKFRRNKA
jgi:bifunctional DNA-binding transcriptional regulator/antitoxin component of YhaV-PrlF toxin-antitoxin module